MNQLFSPDVLKAVRTYYITHFPHHEGDADRMTLSQLWAYVKEHGTEEDQRTVTKITLERFHQAAAKDNDPHYAERQGNIAQANREFDIVERYLEPGIPSGQDFRLKYVNKTVTAARDATIKWVKRSSLPMLVLAGDSGVGKTHLAIAAANAIEGAPVVFRTEPALLMEIKAGMGMNQADEILNAFGRCSVLVLDDLGTEAVMPWSRAAMDNIVNQRWEMAEGGHRTMITTNLPAHKLAPRMASRLGDRSRARHVDIKAPDYRKRQR